jgi:hypothetical protein
MEYIIDDNTAVIKSNDELYFTKQGKDTLKLKGFEQLKELLKKFDE